jgi:hypothetical protein
MTTAGGASVVADIVERSRKDQPSVVSHSDRSSE